MKGRWQAAAFWLFMLIVVGTQGYMLGLGAAGERHEKEQNRQVEHEAGHTDLFPAQGWIAWIEAKVVDRRSGHEQCPDGKQKKDCDLQADWEAVNAAHDGVHVAVASLMLAVVTLALTVLSTFLLYFTLRATRRTAERQLRAYVSVGSGTLTHFVQEDGSQYLQYKFVVRNGGSTPAYDCLHAGNIAAMSDDAAAAYFSSTVDQKPRIGRPIPYVVHSNEEATVDIASHRAIPDEELDEIRDGKRNLYAFGFVQYRDTFHRRRVTRFCRFIESDEYHRSDRWALENPGSSNAVEWLLAPYHNDAT